MVAEAQSVTRWQKLTHEAKRYLGIAAYLYLCFGALLLYKASVLEAHGVGYAHFGLAASKALILAKFMLIAHGLHVGERYSGKPLIYQILYASIVFLLVLAALTVAEELSVGALRHRSVTQSLAEIADGKWMEMASTCFLLWLVLLPYFGFRSLGEQLGRDEFHRMLFGRR